MPSKTHQLTVKVPHLLRDVGNMKLETIVLPKAFKVDLTVSIITKNGEKPTGTRSKRLENEAFKVLEKYEQVIKTEAKILDKKITNLMKDHTEANQKEAKKMILSTNLSVNNALSAVGKAVEDAVIAANKEEIKRTKLLQESKIIVGVKIAKSGFDLASSIVKLVASHGTAVMAYKTAFTSVYNICLEIDNYLKTQDKRREEFDKSIKTYIKFSAEKPINPKTAEQAKHVEACRINYRDSCTETRIKADELSKEAEKMMQLAKKGGGSIAQEISLIAECLKVKREASEINKKFLVVEAHLKEVQKLMTGNNLKVADKTLYERIFSIKPPSLSSMLKTAKAIKKLVDIT